MSKLDRIAAFLRKVRYEIKLMRHRVRIKVGFDLPTLTLGAPRPSCDRAAEFRAALEKAGISCVVYQHTVTTFVFCFKSKADWLRAEPIIGGRTEPSKAYSAPETNYDYLAQSLPSDVYTGR